jgi:hypothetical protein
VSRARIQEAVLSRPLHRISCPRGGRAVECGGLENLRHVVARVRRHWRCSSLGANRGANCRGPKWPLVQACELISNMPPCWSAHWAGCNGSRRRLGRASGRRAKAVLARDRDAAGELLLAATTGPGGLSAAQAGDRRGSRHRMRNVGNAQPDQGRRGADHRVARLSLPEWSAGAEDGSCASPRSVARRRRGRFHNLRLSASLVGECL